MKPAAFEYLKPTTLDEALAVLAENDSDTQVLAGGQSLLPMMNFRLAQPERLVDLNGLSDLSGIEEADHHLVVGAMTRYAELERSPAIRKFVPLIAMALPHIAHSAIRNRGTIGGSTALADPAAEMPALLCTLEADIIVRSAGGERSMPAIAFFRGLYETGLEEDEIVTGIRIPKAKPKECFAFYELARRHGDYAMAGVALAAEDVEPVRGLRCTFFAIGDRPLRCEGAEQAMEGKSAADGGAIEAACRSIAQLDQRDDLQADEATKSHLAQVIFRRALEHLQ